MTIKLFVQPKASNIKRLPAAWKEYLEIERKRIEKKGAMVNDITSFSVILKTLNTNGSTA